MPKICLYFQLHQPWRLTELNVFDVGNKKNYFSGLKRDDNKIVFQKVAQKSYIPMLRLLGSLLKEVPEFVFTISFSGVFIEQAQQFSPEVIQLLKKVITTGRVEVLAETYYHSLAALYSEQEFSLQVARHTQLVQQLFKVTPKVFRNTELIYSDDIAKQVHKLGFKGMLTEAVPRYLHNRPKTKLFYSNTDHPLPLLLKHAELSDDIAFRFSERSWQWYPLTAEKYLEWVEVYGEKELINLFMDFETFGEHQWADSGIFEFFAAFVKKFLTHSWNYFVTPSQVLQQTEVIKKKNQVSEEEIYSVSEPISWADVDRDLTAWRGNVLQEDTLQKVYALKEKIYAHPDITILEDWRKLQTSDHFYYMCTKWAADGDVHAYFSPYDSPYEAYRRYSIALADLQSRILASSPRI